MATVGKKELVQRVAQATELPKNTVDKVLTALVEQIVTALKNGEQVYLAGLGTFKPIDKPATEKRNPQTGGTIKIPPRTVLKFRPSSSVRILKVNK